MNLLGEANRPRVIVYRKDAAAKGVNFAVVDDKSRLQCAGLNRHEAEDERASRERSSDPLGLESCAGYREVFSEA
jgi:hypothetical protein